MPYKDPAQQRAYQRRWVARRKEKWLTKNGPCVKCDSDEELEVDHIDPEKKVSHRIWSWSKARRDRELKKCQVLCSECHKEKTVDQLSKEEHGTLWQYRKGCRCDACREEKSRDNAKRYA